jgi:two-component system, OmpR family, KDP operon response regulator KdpE
VLKLKCCGLIFSWSAMIQTKTLLIICEKAEFYRHLQQGLSGSSYIIKTIPSSVDAIQDRIEQIAPDLLIIDAAPPQLSGIELSLQVRCFSQIPILMFSTLNTKADEIRILDVNSEGWLSEPLGFDLISVRINDLLAKPVA